MREAGRAEAALPGWLVCNRNFVLLWSAYGISALGDHLSELALLTERHALEGQHATRVQALIQFGFFLPFVVLGPLAGWWADRFSRKWTMIAADLLRAGVMFSLIWTVRWLEQVLEPRGCGDYAIVLPLMVTGALAAFFSPSRQALLPTLIRADQLVRANALLSALGTIATILSAVLGGLIVKYHGVNWNYTLDALTFLLSAALLLCLNMSQTRAVPHTPAPGVWTPLRDGFRYVRQHRRVWQLILLGTVFWAAAGVVISVVPALVRDVFGGDIADAGIYRGFLGAGLALGAAMMTILGPSVPIPLAITAALAGGAGWLLLLSAICLFRGGPVLTAVSLVGIGGAGAALLVTIMASLQRFVPDARRGRVFGVSDMCTMAAMVLATGLLGLPNLPRIDAAVPWLLAGTGLVLAVTAGCAWASYQRGQPCRGVDYLLWLVLRCYAAFWLRVQRLGPCTVPQSGPVILALNHTSGVDPIAVLATCPHRLAGFVVAAEYYYRPILKWFQDRAGCVPVDRARPGKSFLSGALRMLKRGGCLAIFPEGTFVAPDADPLPVRPGIGVLALRSDAVVIPCHISGTVYHPNPLMSFFQRHRIRVRYGPPVDLSAWRGRERDPAAPQEVADCIMAKVRELAPREHDESGDA